MKEDIQVALLHRNRLFREGLAWVLAQQPHIAVVGSTATAAEMLREIEQLHPDVFVVGLALPGRAGLGEARQIREACAGVRILMIGLPPLESDILACIEAGAAGYLLQEASLQDLFRSIRTVATGEALCSPKITGLLFSLIAEHAHERERLWAGSVAHLTPRELEIIALIEEGLSNKEIAVRLRIEVPTVKNHVHNVLEKLQLDGRREVVRYAREHGLLRHRFPQEVGRPRTVQIA